MDQIRIKELLAMMDNIIAEQRQVTAQLLEMATPKCRAIITDDIPALQQIMGEEETLLTRLQALEETRRRVAAQLGEAAGYIEPAATNELVLALTREFDPPMAVQLDATIKGFITTYTELIEANQHNTVLINDALNHIDAVVKVISGSTEGVTYSSQGEIGELTTMRRYLNKTV